MPKNTLRRYIEHVGWSKLTYEIREIVAIGRELEKLGVEITWENIGDPIQKGEKLPKWIKDIIAGLLADDRTYGYTDTRGVIEAREFLAKQVNIRGGRQIIADDILFFNGLGVAVAKIFTYLKREARVIGPSPAYSTHSSAEAAHSGYDHLTYNLPRAMTTVDTPAMGPDARITITRTRDLRTGGAAVATASLPAGIGHRYSWIGLFLGLAVHTLIDGMALGASVAAEADHEHAAGLLGIGTFLAVLLHKPLDALSISSLMLASGWSDSRRNFVNFVFAAMCPAGAAAFWFGASHLLRDSSGVLGLALAFSAGVFLCISLGDLLPEVHFHSHDRLKLSAALLAGVALAYVVGFLEPQGAHEFHSDHARESQNEHDHGQ